VVGSWASQEDWEEFFGSRGMLVTKGFVVGNGHSASHGDLVEGVGSGDGDGGEGQPGDGEEFHFDRYSPRKRGWTKCFYRFGRFSVEMQVNTRHEILPRKLDVFIFHNQPYIN
jgi:hypothetical protein